MLNFLRDHKLAAAAFCVPVVGTVLALGIVATAAYVRAKEEARARNMEQWLRR